MQKTRTTIHVGPKLTPVHFDLDLSQFSQRNIWDWIQSKDKFYEWEVVRILEQTLKPGDTFIDVGAHVGYFSLIAAALVGETGFVVACEPDARNMDALHKNMVLNQFTDRRLFCNPVGREVGAVSFWRNADNDGGHALWDVGKHEFNAKSRENPEAKLLPMLTLDYISKLLVDVKNYKLIKIDTEGAEYDVLIGATNLLAKNPECIVIAEINDFGLHQMGADRTQLRDMMERMGYRTFHLSADSEPHELGPYEWPADNGTVFNVMFKK